MSSSSVPPRGPSRGEAWFCTTGLPSDVVFEVQDMSFHLHKFPLMSKSRKIHRMLTEQEEERPPRQRRRGRSAGDNADDAAAAAAETEIEEAEEEEGDEQQQQQQVRMDDGTSYRVTFPDFPGGPGTFEAAAKFCYGVRVELTPWNVAPLRCAAEYLEMNEEHAEDNLAARAEAYLAQSVLRHPGEATKSLKSCEELLPHAEELGIVARCVEAIAARSSAASSRSWSDDLAVLGLHMYKRVMAAMAAREDVRTTEAMESCLVSYAKATPGAVEVHEVAPRVGAGVVGAGAEGPPGGGGRQPPRRQVLGARGDRQVPVRAAADGAHPARVRRGARGAGAEGRDAAGAGDAGGRAHPELLRRHGDALRRGLRGAGGQALPGRGGGRRGRGVVVGCDHRRGSREGDDGVAAVGRGSGAGGQAGGQLPGRGGVRRQPEARQILRAGAGTAGPRPHLRRWRLPRGRHLPPGASAADGGGAGQGVRRGGLQEADGGGVHARGAERAAPAARGAAGALLRAAAAPARHRRHAAGVQGRPASAAAAAASGWAERDVADVGGAGEPGAAGGHGRHEEPGAGPGEGVLQHAEGHQEDRRPRRRRRRPRVARQRGRRRHE